MDQSSCGSSDTAAERAEDTCHTDRNADGGCKADLPLNPLG